MGNNPNAKLYNDLELICRTATDLERFNQNTQDVKPMQSYSDKPKRMSFEELASGAHLEDLQANREARQGLVTDQRVIDNRAAKDGFALLEQQHRLGN